MKRAKREVELVQCLLLPACLVTATVTLGCGGQAEGEMDAGEAMEHDAGIEREIFRHYPTETEEVEGLIGQTQHSIQSTGFHGWRRDVGSLGRLALCTNIAEAGQSCMLPASLNVKWYINPSGFSTSHYNMLRNGALTGTDYWNFFVGVSDLGWTYTEVTSSESAVVRFVAGSVNPGAYPPNDQRHWINVSIDSSVGLTEVPSDMPGNWRRFGAITITIDVNRVLDDGCGDCMNTRLRQTGGFGLALGTGHGASNIAQGSVTQISAAGSLGLGYDYTDRQYCAMDLYSLGNKAEFRKLPSDACSNWSWPN